MHEFDTETEKQETWSREGKGMFSRVSLTINKNDGSVKFYCSDPEEEIELTVEDINFIQSRYLELELI